MGWNAGTLAHAIHQVDLAGDVDDGVWTQTKISHWPDPSAEMHRLPSDRRTALDLDQSKVRPIVQGCFFVIRSIAVDGAPPQGLFGMRRA
jgi:hypothetical protein